MFWKIFRAVWLMVTFAGCVIFMWDDGHMVLPILNAMGFSFALMATVDEDERDRK